MRGARRSRVKVTPITNDKELSFFEQPFRTQTCLELCVPMAGSRSHLEPAMAMGRARAAISRHLRLRARLEQLIRAPQRRRNRLERLVLARWDAQNLPLGSAGAVELAVQVVLLGRSNQIAALGNSSGLKEAGGRVRSL